MIFFVVFNFVFSASMMVISWMGVEHEMVYASELLKGRSGAGIYFLLSDKNQINKFGFPEVWNFFKEENIYELWTSLKWIKIQVELTHHKFYNACL